MAPRGRTLCGRHGISSGKLAPQTVVNWAGLASPGSPAASPCPAAKHAAGSVHGNTAPCHSRRARATGSAPRVCQHAHESGRFRTRDAASASQSPEASTAMAPARPNFQRRNRRTDPSAAEMRSPASFHSGTISAGIQAAPESHPAIADPARCPRHLFRTDPDRTVMLSRMSMHSTPRQSEYFHGKATHWLQSTLATKFPGARVGHGRIR